MLRLNRPSFAPQAGQGQRCSFSPPAGKGNAVPSPRRRGGIAVPSPRLRGEGARRADEGRSWPWHPPAPWHTPLTLVRCANLSLSPQAGRGQCLLPQAGRGQCLLPQAGRGRRARFAPGRGPAKPKAAPCLAPGYNSTAARGGRSGGIPAAEGANARNRSGPTTAACTHSGETGPPRAGTGAEGARSVRRGPPSPPGALPNSQAKGQRGAGFPRSRPAAAAAPETPPT